MFVDEKKLLLKAGKGGDGASLFRREMYVPRGGPDGGDGGNGGSIYAVGQRNLHALTHLTHVDKISAEEGQVGGHRTSSGKSGQNTILPVPLGTVIYVIDENSEEKILDEITEEGKQILLVKGGSGGWGNWHFKSSIQQAPTRFNPGLPGEQLNVRLVLKMIADIGLVGLPNAGKSTLLSVVSSAKPKIANYPFTTLEPALGVANVGNNKSDGQIIIADLPGLIEGASEGKGLGVKFLRHIERTKIIIHCIDSSMSLDEIIKAHHDIRQELESFSKVLLQKPELIALTKIELIDDADLQAKIKALKIETKNQVLPISAVTHKGIPELLYTASKLVNKS